MFRRAWYVVSLICLLSAVSMPSWAYEEDTHFLVTYVICRAVGFTNQEALTIAAVDQGMDDSLGTVANSGPGGATPHVEEEWLWHALDHDGNMKPAGILKRKLDMFSTAMSRPTAQEKLIYLGVFFHYQQDTYAHRHHYDGHPESQNAFTTYNTPLGHLRDGHLPDRPPFDPVAAMMCLEDSLYYARAALKQGFGRQPRAYLADFQPLGGWTIDADWSDSRNGKYFHQIKRDRFDSSVRSYLITLLVVQIDAYTSSIDANPRFAGRRTPDEANFEKVRSRLQRFCKVWSSILGEEITIPSKADKEAQGFMGLTTARLAAGAPAMKNYIVRVKTGTRLGAGTDANISLVLTGTIRRSETFVLNPLISGNAFESGQLDTIDLSAVRDVGNLISITITSDDKYPGSAWYLEWVEIETNGVTRRFNCNAWIDKDHGLSRTLK